MQVPVAAGDTIDATVYSQPLIVQGFPPKSGRMVHNGKSPTERQHADRRFLLGIVAGVGLAFAWPKLAPLATCLQNVAQDVVPIRTTGTPGEDADWVKIYGKMIPVTNEDRMFGPTYNQLIDYYYKFSRPTLIKWSDITGAPAKHPNAPSSQEAQDAYQASLREWQQRICNIEGLCVAQTDKSGAAPSPYSDIPPGFHVESMPETKPR
jgi:hypothetical protein